MQNQFQPEENHAPPSAFLSAPQAPLVAKTEAETRADRLVTERLDAITKRARRARRYYNLSFAGLCLATLLSKFTDHLLPPSEKRLGDLIDCVALLIGFASMFLLLGIGLRRGPKFNAEEIADIGGVRAVAPLFAALQAPVYRKQRTAILAALMTLLPQMKASDAHLLTPAARRTINSWLESYDIAPNSKLFVDNLRISALKALEQVGDSSAILPVKYLTESQSRIPSEVRVRQAAIDCLPMLQANCGSVETARTLLRASQAGEIRPDTLLRPATGGIESNAAELLRGAE